MLTSVLFSFGFFLVQARQDSRPQQDIRPRQEIKIPSDAVGEGVRYKVIHRLHLLQDEK